MPIPSPAGLRQVIRRRRTPDRDPRGGRLGGRRGCRGLARVLCRGDGDDRDRRRRPRALATRPERPDARLLDFFVAVPGRRLAPRAGARRARVPFGDGARPLLRRRRLVRGPWSAGRAGRLWREPAAFPWRARRRAGARAGADTAWRCRPRTPLPRDARPRDDDARGCGHLLAGGPSARAGRSPRAAGPRAHARGRREEGALTFYEGRSRIPCSR